MRYIISGLGFMFVFIGSILSQLPLYNFAVLDVNNWEVYFTPTNSSFSELYYYNSKTYIGGANALQGMSTWIGGFDEYGILHVSANLSYLTDAYVAGPYGFLPNEYVYNKVWKVSRSEIEYHILHRDEPGYQMPEDIATWPAHGDVSNGEEYILAPFVDVNQNGVYDPENGDYPFIYGDQAIYYVINDKWGKAVPEAQKFGVEIRVMAFAYKTGDSTIDDTFFIHYEILNKSGIDYHDVKFGLDIDFNIGYFMDDYIGTDSTQNCFFSYNGDEFDSGEDGYGYKPPAVGLIFLSHPMTSSMRYFCNTSQLGAPEKGIEFYNLMNSRWKDGTQLVHHSFGYPYAYETDTCHFVFPEYSDWTEITEHNSPGDRFGVAAVTIGDFYAGECYSLDVAFLWARDTINYVDIHSPVETMLARIPEVVDFYHSIGVDTVCSYRSVNLPYCETDKVRYAIYPNPASSNVMVETDVKHYNLRVYDSLGNLIYEGDNAKKVDVTHWNSGVYFVVLRSGDTETRKKLIVYK